MEHPIDTKFNIKDCMLTVNVIAKNDLDLIIGSGSFHINKVYESTKVSTRPILVGSCSVVLFSLIASLYITF